MYLTTHAAVGVLVAQQTNNPWAAFLGSLASHFVLDFVPHGDEGVGEWVGFRKRRLALVSLLDLLGLTLLLVTLARAVSLPRFGLVSLGILGSVLPDLLSNVAPVVHQLLQRNWAVRAAHWFQRTVRLTFVWKQQDRLHKWIHNPWYQRLPVTMSEQIGLLVQFFILFVFFATEISVLGK